MLVSGGNSAERERDTAISARLAHRRRLDGVQRDVLEPVRIEHERRVPNLLDRLDAKACLEEDPAANLRRRRDFEARRAGLHGADVDLLAEQVEEPEHEDPGEQRNEDTTNDRACLAVGQVAMVLQREPLGRRGGHVRLVRRRRASSCSRLDPSSSRAGGRSAGREERCGRPSSPRRRRGFAGEPMSTSASAGHAGGLALFRVESRKAR